MNFKSIIKNKIPPRWFPNILRIYFGFRSVFYGGNKVQCPCCERSYRNFVDFGDPREIAVACPGCGSFSRQRLLTLILKSKFLTSNRILSVLHIAPELCISDFLKRQAQVKYKSIDLQSPQAEERMDLTDLHLSEGQFDLVICFHVLEHIVEDQKAMSEICRVLKKGGAALIQVPQNKSLVRSFEDPNISTPELRKKHFGQEDHVRIYGQDFKSRLESAGLDVSLLATKDICDREMIHRQNLLEDETIHLCIKAREV
ncbi:MAG: SAM-dependent methyltransferase [Bacteriovoracaceae bacterium]|nr:SAM-dependent methyltransferase [Bacteriovoracaceae bacterium]